MSGLRCEHARELIPDLVAGRLDASEARRAEAHLAACPECAEEGALVALVLRGRPAVPDGLAERIRAGMGLSGTASAPPVRRRPGGAVLFPWWGLAAAAVAAVALGIGVQSRGAVSPVPPEVPAFAVEGEQGELWLSDDGEIAGAPTLDDLTEEELMTVLEELGGGVA